MSWVMAGWAGALVWSVALVVVDVRSLRLPDALTLPAVPVAVVLAVVTGHPWAVAGGLGWAA
ncbi:prepilin peptidase, partial [Corynebacterium bovis]